MNSQKLLKTTLQTGVRGFGVTAATPTNSAQPDAKQVLQFRQPSQSIYYKQPLYMVKGSKQFLTDSNGKTYLDMFAGIATVSVGHCHPYLNAKLKEQIDKLWHTSCIYLTDPVVKYTEKLGAKMPGNLKVCYFVNSGTEAVDLAIMLARLHTGNNDMITLRNSYHGLAQSVMGATNHSHFKQPVLSNAGFVRTMCPDPYKGLFGGKNCRDSPTQPDRDCNCAPGHCQATDSYVNQLQELFDHDVPQAGVAGLLIESIQGVGGAVQYPKGYVKRAFDLVRSKGGVCISDEVQTGFGRTGTFWGFQGHDVVPDIVTMAKGIANGFPMAAVVTTPEVAKSHSRAAYINTFAANPLACTVGDAVLDVIEEEGLEKNCEVVGTHLLKQLDQLRKESPILGDVRGKGLMIAIELVENKEIRKPLPAEKLANIFEAIKDSGVLVGKGGRFGQCIRIKPPMCVTKADADKTVEVLQKVLREYQ